MSEANMKTLDSETTGSVSLRQAGAGGALRCAVFAIEDAVRQLDWHFQELGLPREEYLTKLAELNALRMAAQDALKPLWKIAGAPG